jgi:DNA invertase Pin-like site-specific DNA recombinase
MFTMIAAFAEFERAMIQERSRAGLIAAKEQGRVGGRPVVLTEQKRRIAEELIKSGKVAVRDIIKTVGCSRSTFYRTFPKDRHGKVLV